MNVAIVRRALLTPLALVVECASIPLVGVLLIVATPLAVLTTRRLSVPRAMVVTIAYLALDVWAFVLCAVAAAVCLLRGQGRDVLAERAYGIGTRILHRLFFVARRVLDLHVSVEDSDDALAAVTGQSTPLIVLSRHAGPGDTFLVVHELVMRGRRTRVLLRAALRLDPAIDVLGSLLSFAFVRRGAGKSAPTLQRITRLAAAMLGNGAFVLFPEGGNVSRERVQRRLQRLREQGSAWQAESAARLRHLGPPFPGGVLAALRGAPHADVLFVAHSGLAGMEGPVWRWIPVHRTLRMRWFLVPCSEVPRDEEGQNRWLFEWWQRLDDTVEDSFGN
ncbi:MAG: 1-acyl-sn-glycerol-3-phosphate acyltransferase [Candidatus Dormibacteria bacterium]